MVELQALRQPVEVVAVETPSAVVARLPAEVAGQMRGPNLVGAKPHLMRVEAPIRVCPGTRLDVLEVAEVLVKPEMEMRRPICPQLFVFDIGQRRLLRPL